MIDCFDPFLHGLLDDGYKIALHLYVSPGKRSVVINAKQLRWGYVFTGRSSTGSWTEAVRDLEAEYLRAFSDENEGGDAMGE